MRIELRDNYGRLFFIAQGAGAPRAGADGTLTWTMPQEALRRAVSSCLRVRVQALAGRTVADEREVTLTIPRSMAEEYPACMWGLSPGYIGHLAAQRIRELGFNMVLGGSSTANAQRLAIEDLKNIPYCARICDRKQLVKQDTIVGIRQEMTKVARNLARFGPYVYSLGDENAMPGDLGYQPEDKPSLLEFLKRRYSSLDDLNRAWGTEFRDWESVQPLSAADAQARRQYTAWHDVLSFREDLYAQRHHDYADAIRTGDHDARVGAEGSEEGDLELTITGQPPSKALEFWGPYRDLRYNALLRSVASRDLVRGNWFGGYRFGRYKPTTYPAFLWDALFDGNNLIQHFALATVETIFNTDYSLSYWNLWYWDDLEMLLDGPGQLVQRASHEYDPVAVLHGQASVHAGMMEAPLGATTSHTAACSRRLASAGCSTTTSLTATRTCWRPRA